MSNGVTTGWDMVAFMGTRAAERLGMISNNIANVNTLGFKQNLLGTWRADQLPEDNKVDLPRERLPNPEPGVYPNSCYYFDVLSRDFSQGALHHTGGENDLAIYGSGFFKVQTPQGIRYTRNGSFRLNTDYQLVTRQGHLVLGQNGPITLNATDKKFSVDVEGGIHLDDTLGDQLAIVDFPNPQGLILEKGGLYAATENSGLEQEAQGYQIQQGVVEESNVDPIAAMVQLIDNSRNFDSYIKILDTFQTSSERVIKEIGRLS